MFVTKRQTATPRCTKEEAARLPNETDWFDPMIDELFIPPCYSGHPSKEECIKNMLVSAPG
jgi:hypothetical protein